MYQIFIERALENMRRHPDKPALARPGEDEVTYGQLLWRINGARQYLTERGLKAGETVVLSASRSFSFVFAYLALHSLGAVAVPLDPQTPANRLQHIRAMIGDHRGFWIDGDHGYADIALFDELVAVDSELDQPTDQSKLADIMFTSGTTAKPKGVRLTHGNISCAINNINLFIGNSGDDIEINPMPLSHSFGLARLRCTLYAGGQMVIVDGVARPKTLFKAMEQYRATGLGMVAPAWMVLKRLSGDAISRFKDQLRYLELGSAPMAAEEKAYLAGLLPNTKVCMHYGLTEASRAVYQDFHAPPDTLSTVGRQAPLAEIQIFDQDGNELPPGQAGEICVKGGMVTEGYLDISRDQCFRGDFFRTGDLGYLREDGYIILTGRLKEIINVGGNKVNPFELDRVLETVPEIAEAACVGMPDPLTGEVVAAFVVPQGDRRYTLDELKCMVKDRLEPYQMPQALIYVDCLPKTGTGKIQRARLLENLPQNQ